MGIRERAVAPDEELFGFSSAEWVSSGALSATSVAFLRDMIASGAPHGPSASAWEDDTTRRAEGADQATCAAVGGGQCVGLAGAGHSDESLGVELFSMWAPPQVRRLGIGRQLVLAVGWARAAHDDAVWLRVTQDNEPAIRLYERMGSVATSTRKPLASFPGKDVILMVLPLGRGADD